MSHLESYRAYILELRKAGASYEAIAQSLGVTRMAVCKWVKKWEEARER